MKYFNLFSNVFVTKGENRILISDFLINSSELFPSELLNVLEDLNNNSIENVINLYEIHSKKLVRDYINLLLEKQYGFLTDGDWDKNFPPLSLDFTNYSVISNIFVEIKNILVLIHIRNSIENLRIKQLVIYFHGKISLKDFYEIENIFLSSSLEGIEVFSSFHNEIDNQFLKKINAENSRIHSLVFYNCTSTFEITNNLKFEVNLVKSDIKPNYCGVVNSDYFNTNLSKVSESINHNSCLHKKIGIDIGGNIKNCPLMPQSFGNIKDTTLEEALNRKDFKKYWNLGKDSIEVCRDCEFRHICTDCRAYTERTHENEEGLDTSKPLKCGYNPYLGEWEEWSTNPLKEKAIKFYGLQQLVKKK